MNQNWSCALSVQRPHLQCPAEFSSNPAPSEQPWLHFDSHSKRETGKDSYGAPLRAKLHRTELIIAMLLVSLRPEVCGTDDARGDRVTGQEVEEEKEGRR